MLSILCSTLWGHSGGFSVGVFIGGLMMNSKHNYKREDVKEDKLKKWYEDYLKNKKYPNLEKVSTDADNAFVNVTARLNVKTIDELKTASEDLKDEFIEQMLTKYSLIFFGRYPDIADITPTDKLEPAQDKMKAIYESKIGKLIITHRNAAVNSWTTYSGTGDANSVWNTTAHYADTESQKKRQLLSAAVTNQATANTQAAEFERQLKADGFVDADFVQLKAAATAVSAAGITDPEKIALQAAGNDLINRWAVKVIASAVEKKFERAALKTLFQFDDAIENAKTNLATDEATPPTADEYDPDSTGQALTSPELSKESGEQGKWKTLEGEVKSRRIGLTYGFSVGYEKELNKNHAFVGGNAFAKKDNMTIKYNLQVEQGNHPSFGELETKPGYTFGVTIVAGKHLNPVFSVFGRGTFEFTKYGFTYNLTNDSPKMVDEKIATQKLGNWVKQAAVGVGARYNFAPLWSAEVCYDFLPATKTTVRDFNKLGDDNRRRGYIYTASQHRAFLKVVRFFNM